MKINLLGWKVFQVSAQQMFQTQRVNNCLCLTSFTLASLLCTSILCTKIHLNWFITMKWTSSSFQFTKDDIHSLPTHMSSIRWGFVTVNWGSFSWLIFRVFITLNSYLYTFRSKSLWSIVEVFLGANIQYLMVVLLPHNKCKVWAVQSKAIHLSV